jgi:hypothetical protein
MELRCKDGDLAVMIGDMPGCESNIGMWLDLLAHPHSNP